MKRLLIVALAFACLCTARDYEPNEVEISLHRRDVFDLSRDYIVETFNLQVLDESSFNPVRFNSSGVWGNFEARIKELGGDRFEVQGWLSAAGNSKERIHWSVHIRYPQVDPEAWRYLKIGDEPEAEPEVLGWKFGDYYSIGYRAEYEPHFLVRSF